MSQALQAGERQSLSIAPVMHMTHYMLTSSPGLSPLNWASSIISNTVRQVWCLWHPSMVRLCKASRPLHLTSNWYWSQELPHQTRYDLPFMHYKPASERSRQSAMHKVVSNWDDCITTQFNKISTYGTWQSQTVKLALNWQPDSAHKVVVTLATYSHPWSHI